jgi:ABC-type uncharacterized transport system substrate-binding protein
LVGLQPEIIVTYGTPATVAVQREKRTIPIVFAGVTDPVASGIDIRIIQALLGHDKLETTARYTRVATGMIANIKSPLDLLSQPRKSAKKRSKATPLAA